METMTVFRSRFGRVFSVVTWVVLAVAEAPVLGDTLGLLRSLPLATLIGFTVWAAFWRPVLRVDDAGLHVRNVIADYDIEWGAVQQVDTKWGLTIFTELGRVSVWAAPAPGRHAAFTASRDQGQHLPESTYVSGTVRPGDLATTESGAAAALIRRRWEGRLDESGLATRRYSVGVLVTFGVLVVAAAAGLSF